MLTCRVRHFLAAVGLGVSEFRIAHIAWCFRHGFVFQWFHAWIWVCFMHGYKCSGIAIANGHGERQGRQRTIRSAFILLVALQLLFSRFISFRVIAYFFRPPTPGHVA